MLLGTTILLVAVVHTAGSMGAAVAKLRHIDPALISPSGVDGILSPKFMTSFWILVYFGVIGLPHTAVRCISYRDSDSGPPWHDPRHGGYRGIDARHAPRRRSGTRGIARTERARLGGPYLDGEAAAAAAGGHFPAAPLAAIMSTINAQLLQSSATIIKDLYLSLQPRQTTNERRLKRISSLVTLVLGLLLAAWRPPEMIIWLNLLAFGGMEAVFLWPLVLGLYWERANAAGALSSMITGGASYALLADFNLQPGDFHPIVLALAISLLAFLAGNRFGCPAATPLHRYDENRYALDTT